MTATDTERAVIGDSIRIPVVWCQFGSCVARHADPAALGEADVRARAIAAGWCEDAFGRLVCPDCQWRYPLWSARPLAVPAIRQGGRAGTRPAAAAGRHRREHERRSAWIMPA